MLALAAEACPLLDTEPVLLVDDHEPETTELDRLLDEGVGADRAADLAPGQRGAPGRPLPRLQRGGQQRDGHAERLEELAEGHEVLFGQDLGGGHDRRLVARLDRGQDGERGHDRLARSDIALKEPMHRVRRRHVASDLVPDPLLGARELPRQRRAQPRDQVAARIHRNAAGASDARPQDREPELEQ